MKPLRDEDLILHLFGEPDAPADLESRLAASPELARRHAELQIVLAAVEPPPEPELGDDYGRRVWARLAPRLEAERAARRRRPLGGWWGWLSRLDVWGRPRRRGVGDRGWGWAPAALAASLALAVGLVAIGFVLGRAGRAPEPAFTLAENDRERILTGQVARHLDGSERLLTELANASASAPFDAAAEREWAAALLDSNRLYRRAAAEAGQRRIVALLDELEPILLDLAHSPDAPDPGEMDWLRQRLDEKGTLFKLRVTAARIGSGRSETRRAAPAAGATTL